MSPNWLESTERAVEVLEGQVALAEAVGVLRIETDAANIKKVLDEVLRLRGCADCEITAKVTEVGGGIEVCPDCRRCFKYGNYILDCLSRIC